MGGMDPHAALGLGPDATPDEVAKAYRRLAKRHHPDRRPEDADAAAVRMAEINAAYAMLRDDLVAQHEARRPAAREQPEERRPGAWLDARVQRALGGELLRVLEPGEPVTVVTDAVTWDSHHVRIALSDRRLLWLRDDAPTDRVKWLRFRAIESVDGRLRGPWQRVGELVVRPRSGRKVSFSELEPSALRLLLTQLRQLVG
jgi:hypothetical protein